MAENVAKDDHYPFCKPNFFLFEQKEITTTTIEHGTGSKKKTRC